MTPLLLQFEILSWQSLGGIKFLSDEDVQFAINEYFESLKGSFFKRGITALKPDEKNASSYVVIMLKSINTFAKVYIYFYDQVARKHKKSMCNFRNNCYETCL